MEQENPILHFDYQDGVDIFTNIIEIRIIDDTVCLGLGIKSKDKAHAIVKTKVYMTVNHFFRFVEAGNGLISRIQEDIKKAQTNKGSQP